MSQDDCKFKASLNNKAQIKEAERKEKGRMGKGKKAGWPRVIPATVHRRADLTWPRQHTGADPVVGGHR